MDRLAVRVRELDERYAVTVSEVESEVEELSDGTAPTSVDSRG